MAKVAIEYGLGESNGYLGIQPPLTAEQKAWIEDMRRVDSTIPETKRFFERKQHIGEPFSSFVTDFNSQLGRDEAEMFLYESAQKIAAILEKHGDEVDFDEEPQFVGGIYYLFGCQAEPSSKTA